MSGKAYLTKKKRDTQGLTVNQIPAGCRFVLPSLKTKTKDYKQSFTFNENPAAYLIPLTKPASDIDTIYDDLSTLQRPRIRDKSGRYPDTLLLSALFSILQNDQDQTGDTATVDIRDFLVFTGKLRSNTAPAHYAELEAKLDPLLYLGGIIGGNFYPVLSEYQINEDQRLFTFKSPYCKALINQIKQDQSAAGNRAAYCRAIQASICTARNKAAAAAVCYAACIILQSGKEKKTTAKEKKTKTKTVTLPSLYKLILCSQPLLFDV